MSGAVVDRRELEGRVGQGAGTVLLMEVALPEARPGAAEDLPDLQMIGRRVSQTLERAPAALPETATLARYGGRLVAVWLPGDEPIAAAERFSQICAAVKLRLVAGAAACAAPGDAARVLFDRADRALGRARGAEGWAVWDEESDRGRPRADPLAGIFSADPARTYRHVELLLGTARSVSAATDLETLLPAALDRILQLTGTERAMLLLADEQGALSVALARDASGQPAEAPGGRSRSIPHSVFDSGRTVCVTEREMHTGDQVRTSSLMAFALRTVICIPLEAGGKRIGVFYTDGQLPQDSFGPEDLAFTEAVCGQVALAIEHTRLIETGRRLLRDEIQALRETATGAEILGEDAAMTAVLDQVARVAASGVRVLVRGDSGTGKETIARAIHEVSAARGGPFVVIACGALPEGLMESELFGHEEGAFSGATQQRRGLFEQAERGTILLDEVSDLSLATQAKLLRVLADGTYRRVGGEQSLSLDAQIIASTRADLRAMVENSLFREDLYYRLKVAEIELPPLAARGRDVLLLAAHYTRVFGPRELSADAEAALLAHDWAGNVRELRHRVLRACTLGEPPFITAADLGLDGTGSAAPDLKSAREAAKREVERAFVVRALAATRGNVTQAAGQLGMSRSRLNQLLAALGVDPAAFRPEV